jgi:hypothetical protein
MRLLDIAVAYRLSSFCPVPYKIDELSRSKLQGSDPLRLKRVNDMESRSRVVGLADVLW